MSIIMYQDTPELQDLRNKLFLLGFTYKVLNYRSNPPLAAHIHYELIEHNILVKICTDMWNGVVLFIDGRSPITCYKNYKYVLEVILEEINDKK